MSQAESRPNGESIQKVANVLATMYPLGYQQITSLSSAQALTPPTNARIAVVHPETQAVRWRDDGTNPTPSVGMILPVGGELVYQGNLATVRFIEQTASAKINVSYYS